MGADDQAESRLSAIAKIKQDCLALERGRSGKVTAPFFRPELIASLL
jgi:hypothetical protein